MRGVEHLAHKGKQEMQSEFYSGPNGKGSLGRYSRGKDDDVKK
jgi:hypothetical protein